MPAIPRYSFTLELKNKLEGLNVKSGSIVVTEDSSQAVTFNTAFASTPNVTVNPISADSSHTATHSTPTVNGFTVYMNKTGGGAAGDVTVEWIATNVGNP